MYFCWNFVLEKIASLRVIVKEARQKLAKMMNKDNQVIEEALQGGLHLRVYGAGLNLI